MTHLRAEKLPRTLLLARLLTNDSEDVSDGGHKDDQQIDHEDETKRDADVY